jgi:hypothetical protein
MYDTWRIAVDARLHLLVGLFKTQGPTANGISASHGSQGNSAVRSRAAISPPRVQVQQGVNNLCGAIRASNSLRQLHRMEVAGVEEVVSKLGVLSEILWIQCMSLDV